MSHNHQIQYKIFFNRLKLLPKRKFSFLVDFNVFDFGKTSNLDKNKKTFARDTKAFFGKQNGTISPHYEDFFQHVYNI